MDVKKRFGDARRTAISPDTSDLNVEDLIAEEDCVITISHQGYIKRQALSNFRSLHRGGKGVKGGSGKVEDFSEHLFMATTHGNILFFTNKGRVYRQKGYEIPEQGRIAKGSAIVNLLPVEPGEKITAVIAVGSDMESDMDKFMFMATNQGTVKKTPVKEFNSARRAGLIAINLDKDEELIDVKLTNGKDDIIMATRNGIAIHFNEEDVRPMGRTAHGVRGITLRKDDTVVSMDCTEGEGEVLTVAEGGLGKRTKISEYRQQTRGGKGIINLKITDKTGLIVGSKILHDDKEIMLISAAGVIIRLHAKEISTFGRNAQGVILMNLDKGDKVAAVAVVNAMEDDE